MAQTVHGFVFEDMEGGAPSRTYSKCKLESKEHISALSVGHDKGSGVAINMMPPAAQVRRVRLRIEGVTNGAEFEQSYCVV